MSVREGNRFYPHKNLPAVGVLHKAKEPLEAAVSRLSVRSLSGEQVQSLYRLMDIHCWLEEWSQLEELCSWALSLNPSLPAKGRLYRGWMEALRQKSDSEGLSLLGLHLLRQRGESVNFLALALFALTWAGRTKAAEVVYHHLRPLSEKRSLCWQAMGVYLSEHRSDQARVKGVSLLEKLTTVSTADYLTHKHFLDYSLECGMTDAAARALNLIQERFPCCPEPHWALAVTSMDSHRWGEAVGVLQELLVDNPKNTDAILALARCFEKSGDIMAARELLQECSKLFPSWDYEFNVLMGSVNSQLFERYGMKSYHSSAVRHFARSLSMTKPLQISDVQIQLKLMELNAGVGEKSFLPDPKCEKPSYWVLAANDLTLRTLLSQKHPLMRVPLGVTLGDVVFLAHTDDKLSFHDFKIIGLLEATSAQMVDTVLGTVIQVGNLKALESAVEWKRSPETAISFDNAGGMNFSSKGHAYFFQISSSCAEVIVSASEKKMASSVVNSIFVNAG